MQEGGADAPPLGSDERHLPRHGCLPGAAFLVVPETCHFSPAVETETREGVLVVCKTSEWNLQTVGVSCSAGMFKVVRQTARLLAEFGCLINIVCTVSTSTRGDGDQQQFDANALHELSLQMVQFGVSADTGAFREWSRKFAGQGTPRSEMHTPGRTSPSSMARTTSMCLLSSDSDDSEQSQAALGEFCRPQHGARKAPEQRRALPGYAICSMAS